MGLAHAAGFAERASVRLILALPKWRGSSIQCLETGNQMRVLRVLGIAGVFATAVVSMPVMAEPATAASSYDDSSQYGNYAGYGKGRNLGVLPILADVFLLRPVGVGMTLVGGALLVASSPFTGLASIAPPHDAFQRASNALVVGPAGFTLNRPLGELTYQRSGVYPNLTKPEDRGESTQVGTPMVRQTVKPAQAKNAAP